MKPLDAPPLDKQEEYAFGSQWSRLQMTAPRVKPLRPLQPGRYEPCLQRGLPQLFAEPATDRVWPDPPAPLQ